MSKCMRPDLFRPDDPAIQKNPYPYYQGLREEKPILKSSLGGSPCWVVSRRADILKILLDPATYSNRVGPIHNMLTTDPPEHERLRKMVSSLFTRDAVAPMSARIRENAKTLIEQQLVAGDCDIVRDFAGPLTVGMIAQMLGIAVPQLDRIRQLTKLAAQFVLSVQIGRPPSIESRQAREEVFSFILGIIVSHSFEDGAVISVLSEIYAKAELTEEEVVNFVILLLVAGHTTTTNLIANSVYMLAQRPSDLDRLNADSAFIPRFLEEVLRTRPSFQRTARITTRDVELHGELIPKGSLLRLLLGSANRDPEAFVNGEEFDPEAKRRLHSAFGQGIHSCLGSWLARLEATTTLEVLASAISSIKLDPEKPFLELSGGTFNDFGFESLPVLLTRRTEHLQLFSE